MQHTSFSGTDTQGWPEQLQVRQVPRKGELPGNHEYSAIHDGLLGPLRPNCGSQCATEAIDK